MPGLGLPKDSSKAGWICIFIGLAGGAGIAGALTSLVPESRNHVTAVATNVT